ncbi:uncharacterized protein LOC110424237 [Herrania umbratica]|uniref:Uncharacterized protein LOC110424237 n=1 Tax=Herrania umbratica TaxID=108875 RepID=A0A6J1B5I3_9ROSI|nr:uncharacterized protein LOC110424237 [Herrania umbratica]XP_021294453.1 uncharacterized protein LOC110424237 [Herrania umbratica]
MDSKSKGIAWVGNIYQKFEAMCMEVDDMVCEETFRCVENHLQTVGANVKQFCTEFMQDVLLSPRAKSVEERNLSLVQNTGVTACENSNITIDEDKSQKELIHSSSVQSVDDVHFGSVDDVHFGLSSEQSTKDESALAHSGSIPSDSVILAQACKNELQDTDSTLDDTSLETTEEASHQSVSEVELEAALLSLDEAKLEESCIIVDSGDLQSQSNEAGKRRSYKKKFRESFSSKLRLRKQDREQHAGSSKEKGKNAGRSSQTDKAKSQDMEFSESDWELV